MYVYTHMYNVFVRLNKPMPSLSPSLSLSLSHGGRHGGTGRGRSFGSGVVVGKWCQHYWGRCKSDGF